MKLKRLSLNADLLEPSGSLENSLSSRLVGLHMYVLTQSSSLRLYM